jgi:D-3-phosphoglycerate dehydrogenase
MFQVVIAEPIAPEGLSLLEAASDVACVYLTDADRPALLAALADAHVLLIGSRTRVDAELLSAAPHLKIVAVAGLGMENVDLPAATERSVMVMNMPRLHAAASAEYTLGLILALARHIPAADRSLRGGEWLPDTFRGDELRGKVLGVIGLGEAGHRVADLAQAFGMTVIANDPYVSEEVAHQQQVMLADLDEVLERSDFLSLHVTATRETLGLIGRKQIARMKRGARLINVAWGKIVDQEALLEALESGHLAGAALDAFAEEPPPDVERLRAAPNLVITPRLGSATHETLHAIGVQLAQQVLDALREIDFRNVINLPFASSSGYERLRGYLKLAEALGVMQVALADGPIEGFQVECLGESLWDQVRPITVALLKGMLTQLGVEQVNYVSAPLIAHERGIHVSQARGLTQPDYPTLVACKAVGPGWERVMAGTVFGELEPRILQIGRFRTELKPAGTVLAIRSVDMPGVIGQIGTLLGKLGVNIAAMDYGRILFGGDALSLLTTDSRVSDEVLTRLMEIEPIEDARQIVFEG